MVRSKLEIPVLVHYTQDDGGPPVVMQEPPPSPDGWSRVAADLLAASSSESDAEVDDIPLGASATTPCHREVLPQPPQRQHQQQQQSTAQFFLYPSAANAGGASSSRSTGAPENRPQAIADILCEEAKAWEARVEDANTRLEEMKEQSERRIRELELQVSRLALENTNLKKQLHLGVAETPRPPVPSGAQSARVPLISSSSLGQPPTPLRACSKSARRTVEAIAGTSTSVGLLQQFPRSTLSGSFSVSPGRSHTISPPRRQNFLNGFSSEFPPCCPPLLDSRWHPAAGGVASAVVR